MKKKRPAFFCLPYNLESSIKLEVEQLALIKDNINWFGTHTTLYYGKDKDRVSMFIDKLLGKDVCVTIDSLYFNEKVFAYKVIIEDDIYYGTSSPHITVATIGETKPFESNNLLLDKNSKKYSSSLTGKKYFSTISAAIYTSKGLIYTTNKDRLKV